MGIHSKHFLIFRIAWIDPHFAYSFAIWKLHIRVYHKIYGPRIWIDRTIQSIRLF
jgi:hypothetical protein